MSGHAERPSGDLYSHEHEMCVLGSMLLSERAAEDALAMISAEHFHRPAHRVIFATMRDLIQQGKPAADFEILRDSLGDRLQEIGGEEYLIEVAQFVPSPANLAYYATIVRDKAELRVLATAGRALVDMALDGSSSVDEVRAFASGIAAENVSRSVPFFHFRDIDSEGEDRGITTGFKSLDVLVTTGGYPSGQLSIVSAYHKGGKSTFMLSSFAHQAQLGIGNVLYATFADLDGRRLKKRLVRILCGWQKRPLTSFEAQRSYDDALWTVNAEWTAYGYDSTQLETGWDVETFATWLTAQNKRTPFVCVFVDYAQELSSSDRKATNSFVEQDICALKLSRLAAKLGIPIVVGSQITEGTKEARAKTKLSRKWEEVAGLVLRLEREGETNATVIIEFSRFGPQKKRIDFLWNAERLRFEEVE